MLCARSRDSPPPPIEPEKVPEPRQQRLGPLALRSLPPTAASDRPPWHWTAPPVATALCCDSTVSRQPLEAGLGPTELRGRGAPLDPAPSPQAPPPDRKPRPLPLRPRPRRRGADGDWPRAARPAPAPLRAVTSGALPAG